ncbi:extracellular catalytic domain type 1 short-chain-length polyhydroxyalkanoate depolymerase [Pseudonocardia spinosispora]|uniref:extracellular catalytic domain type 1 short-chain-length polyhydroxyalkanoate depolymerase n=1 Tax=Pseudonocardia spinosispora TaxID=103441 RepID=UPI000426C0FE|nr:PHB depolymerase family esterase [Pseudonocardia spinosispora]
MRSLRSARVWLAAAIAVVATAMTALPASAAPVRETSVATVLGLDETGVYSSDQGQVSYQVHVPPGRRPGTRLPVMMAVHGCAMTGYGLNSMKSTTQFNRLADREGFIVVYPTQSLLRNTKLCWNSLDPAHQHRGRGEPELLAGVARNVVRDFGGDPDRVHVAGASSGAGTAVILAVTYPDVFATATSVAGGEYGFYRVDLNKPDEVTPTDNARLALAEMGPRARQVPLLVVQGDKDTTVPPVMAERLVQQWAALDDLVPDGRIDGDVDDHADETTRHTPPGIHPYTYRGYTDGQRTLIEYFLIEGQGHAWSGPDGFGLFTDRQGPDLAEITWKFASNRRR